MTSSRKAAGWPSRASRSCSWSARTPPPTARISATSGCSRRCCPSSRDRRRRAGAGVLPPARRDPPRTDRGDRATPTASFPTSTSASSTRARPCSAGCAASATPRASSTCSSGSATWPPSPGVRSNVIVGFPGETEDDLQTLCDFLEAARLDVTGVFGYSDEDGTEAASYDGKLDEDDVRERTERVSFLVEELNAQRAEERIGEVVDVLIEEVDGDRPRAAPTTRARKSTVRRPFPTPRPGPGWATSSVPP